VQHNHPQPATPAFAPPPALGHRRTGAFTLIELLVVIAVISLLAALTVPVLNRAVTQAEQVKCRGQLKEFGHALSMYCTQYNRYYPPTGISYRYVLSTTAQGKLGLGLLFPEFMADGRMFYCPSMIAEGTTYESLDRGFRYYPDGDCNTNYMYAVHAADNEALKRPQPSKQCMVADSVIRYRGGDWGCGHYMHVTGYNVLHADNSVNWYPDPDESIAWAKIHSGTTRLHEAWDAFTNNTPN